MSNKTLKTATSIGKNTKIKNFRSFFEKDLSFYIFYIQKISLNINQNKILVKFLINVFLPMLVAVLGVLLLTQLVITFF